MAGERCLHRDFRRLEVPDLADHDDVGILPEEGPQGGGEVEPDVLVHLDLVDPVEVELDGILGRTDVRRALVELREGGVQGGRLARPGRARDEDHPEGPRDHLLVLGENGLLEAQLRHVELQVGLVEESEDDLLAPEHRQHADAEVHLLAAPELHLDATVLGQTPLRDVEVAHDLEAADDRVLQLDGRLHDLVEHAVDAVADPHGLLVGLDVDVGGILPDGVEQDEVHKLDDRRVAALFSRSTTLMSSSSPSSISNSSSSASKSIMTSSKLTFAV